MLRLFMVTTLLLTVALNSLAADRPIRLDSSRDGVLHGGSIQTEKATADTVFILGGPDRLDGRFEDGDGNPTWNGWTHRDLTRHDEIYWHTSDHMAIEGDYSMFCGTLYDGEYGYGNNWDEILLFTHQVDDPTISSEVRLTLKLYCEGEPTYDVIYFEIYQDGFWGHLFSHDGLPNSVHDIDETITFEPSQYQGAGLDEIHLRFRFVSDYTHSDEDGLWPSEGAAWLDDIRVEIDGTEVDFEDFEDQDSDRWQPMPRPFVGDFAALYTNLQDLDPCVTNFTAQVAFIDDGIVVPGTGGSSCTTWCYGPGGYIVNNTGGLDGVFNHIHNMIESPVYDWPAGCDQARFDVGVYEHEELGPRHIWPGMFHQWFIRSTSDPEGAPIDQQPYENDNLVEFGGPQYLRQQKTVTHLLTPDRVQVQVALTVFELGHQWGWFGTDGTPAPYFDNVSLRAWPNTAPHIVADEIHLANDGFPASGHLDHVDLAANSVRFDMAANIAQDVHYLNEPGDSLVIEVVTTRSGAVLSPLPRMVVRMAANPLFDGVRTLPEGFDLTDNIITGTVIGDTVRTVNGLPAPDRFSFDLPDTGFFYPGDVIHYYFEAGAVVGSEQTWSMLPADTTGYSRFYSHDQYDQSFTVHALPTLHSSNPGDQPRILFWNDAGRYDGESKWYFTFRQTYLTEGGMLDHYKTTGPSSGQGNGLGGRATAEQLEHYEVIIYSCGDLSTNLLSNGDFLDDPSNDLALLTAWLEQGDKHMFLTGDNLASSILDEGAAGVSFSDTYFNVTTTGNDIRPFISNQYSPQIKTVVPGPVDFRIDTWLAHGGCPNLNAIDMITPREGAVSLAEFCDPSGQGDIYPYTAMVYNHHLPDNARVILMPFDLSVISDAPDWDNPYGVSMAARSFVLDDIMTFFGSSGSPGTPITVPESTPLAFSNHPNPFNPTTTVFMNLPRPDQVSLKVFDLRGRLVRTLVDERLEAGPHEIRWNGHNDQGGEVASGVYFAEMKTTGEVRVNKMTLVR